MEKKMTVHQTSYGAINGDIMGDTCPTCHGIGRIPRGEVPTRLASTLTLYHTMHMLRID